MVNGNPFYIPPQHNKLQINYKQYITEYTFMNVYQSVFTRETVAQDTKTCTNLQDWLPMAPCRVGWENSAESLSAPLIPRDSVDGLELTAVSCESPEQDTLGSVMEGLRMYTQSLKELHQKLKKCALEVTK